MSRKHARKAARPRSRATVLSVVGELLLTAGALVGLYVVWQLYIGDYLISNERYATANTVTEGWAQAAAEVPLPDPVTDEAGTVWYPPPVIATPEADEVFATLQIPRFGTEFNYPVVSGTGRYALDNIGIGAYVESTMPGQPGNFAMAGHRAGWGGPFYEIDKLRLGDPIVVETPEGWFTYRFRDIEYVVPTTVTVLDPVPHQFGVAAVDSIITITACSPIGTTDERIIAYGVFESFQPRAEGPPQSLEVS